MMIESKLEVTRGLVGWRRWTEKDNEVSFSDDRYVSYHNCGGSYTTIYICLKSSPFMPTVIKFYCM